MTQPRLKVPNNAYQKTAKKEITLNGVSDHHFDKSE